MDEHAATGRTADAGSAGAHGIVEPDSLVPDHVLDDLGQLETARLRALRAACEEAEEGVSYARRLLQGRLDLLRAELAHREDGSSQRILDELPNILAAYEVATDPLKARSTRVRVPVAAEAYERQLDEVLPESLLAGPDDELDRDELDAALARASEHERVLSERRRALFRRIDALRDELAARYKDGRADVADLLS